MSKPQQKRMADEFADLSRSVKWATSHGTYIAGRAYMDEADHTASQMETKWGAGRLRLLVDAELRVKFDRQRYLFNQALWHGDELEAVRRESMRMVKAWLALDKAAEAAGHGKLSPQVWEVALKDGTVAAIVPDSRHYEAVLAEGRKMAVYTLDEIGRILSETLLMSAVKQAFPGSTVANIEKNITDPLRDLADSHAALDDTIPF